MTRLHKLGVVTAATAAALLAVSSVAVAGPGHPHGGPGWNHIVGTMDADVPLDGTDGKDKILAKAGDDVIDAGMGRDLVRGMRGADEIHGGEGPDKLHGGRGGDTIYGDNGHDRVKGGPGDDTIHVDGDGTRDWVFCGPGDDTVFADEIDRVARNCEHVNPAP